MIGIDVGGANLKVATPDGIFIHYCPLWQESPLARILSSYAVSDTSAAVVMSGELADCFSSKTEGIGFITDAVREVFPQALFYGTDAVFHDGPVPELAAANWLASSDFLMNRFPGSLFVDFGSTTLDLIPLCGLEPLKRMTDLARLRQGYLVYTGLLRTTVPALIHEVQIGGIATPVSPEYFACSGDVHLVLGHIAGKDYAADTPDKKGTDRLSCLRRLARVVCSDLEEVGEEAAVTSAKTFWKEQRSLVCRGIRRVQEQTGACCPVCAGIGGPLISDLTGGLDLRRILGSAADALPAFAVREVALRDPSILR